MDVHIYPLSLIRTNFGIFPNLVWIPKWYQISALNNIFHEHIDNFNT